MVIINFAHPITEPQRQRIEDLAGSPIERVLDLPCGLDDQHAFAEQAGALVDAAGFSAAEWQMLPLIVNLPSLCIIAALVLVEIHGRAGYFPAVLRLRPVAGLATRQFEVAEILNLQSIRDLARSKRNQ